MKRYLIRLKKQWSISLPLYPRKLKEMTDKTGGSSKYARNNAPPVPASITGSVEIIVSAVDDAIGLATSIAFEVC